MTAAPSILQTKQFEVRTDRLLELRLQHDHRRVLSRRSHDQIKRLAPPHRPHRQKTTTARGATALLSPASTSKQPTPWSFARRFRSALMAVSTSLTP